jgi:tRNA(adenine34) deaminase
MNPAPSKGPQPQDEQFMALALQQAERAWQSGEVPVGAVLVMDERVIALAHNQPIALRDPSAHAEMLALRAAGEVLNNYRMPGATLYVTLEPCAMCAAAMLHARLKRVVFAAADPKTGAAGSVVNLFAIPALNHQTVVDGGVLADAAAVQLRTFFRERRGRRPTEDEPS